MLVFHSTLDVRCSVFDVHQCIVSTRTTGIIALKGGIARVSLDSQTDPLLKVSIGTIIQTFDKKD